MKAAGTGPRGGGAPGGRARGRKVHEWGSRGPQPSPGAGFADGGKGREGHSRLLSTLKVSHCTSWQVLPVPGPAPGPGVLKEPSLGWAGTHPAARKSPAGRSHGDSPAAQLPQAQSPALGHWVRPGAEGEARTQHGQQSRDQSASPQGTQPSLGLKARVSHQDQVPGPWPG